jgi:hypothetical protein
MIRPLLLAAGLVVLSLAPPPARPADPEQLAFVLESIQLLQGMQAEISAELARLQQAPPPAEEQALQGYRAAEMDFTVTLAEIEKALKDLVQQRDRLQAN